MKMVKRWPSQTFYLFILTHCVSGHLEGIIIKTEANHALPGSNVTLECSILNGDGIHVTQTQWSKIDDTSSRTIAVYNPSYGITYLPFSKTSYKYSVAFSKTHQHCLEYVNRTGSSHIAAANDVQCNQWTLHLTNVSVSLSGRYECSFATYPDGTKAAEIDLIIKAEDETEYVVKEILLNQTLEIPCLKNMTSVNLAMSPLKWLMGENGHEETTLITNKFYHQYVNMTDNLLYKKRIQLGLDNALKISPVKVVDDGKMFSCHVIYHPERILKSITKVKVFAKPEISVTFQNSANGTVGEGSLLCIVRKAFPKPNLTWYVDGEILKDQSGGMSSEAEVVKDAEDGLYQLSSVLRIQNTNQSATNQTFWCMCDFPFIGNKTLTISSEKIVVSSDHESNEVPFSAFTTTTIQDSGISTFPSTTQTTTGLQTTSSASRNFTSPVTSKPVSTIQRLQTTSSTSRNFTSPVTSKPVSTTQRLSNSTTAARQSNVNTTLSRETVTLPGGNLSSSTMVDPASFTKLNAFLSTAGNLVNATMVNAENVHFSWPAVVASLLLFCTFLIILGIRKWCQYQKEIMNRPPSFKPPPPPIKYTCMVESDGTSASCHELENL